MEPLLAKKKKGRKESGLPWSSILNEFLQEVGTRGVRMEPGRSPPDGGASGKPQCLFSPETQQGPRPGWRGGGGQGWGPAP